MVGNEVKIDGMEYHMMKESDIIGYWSRLRPRRRPRSTRATYRPSQEVLIKRGIIVRCRQIEGP